jgi:hypothetical protein
MRLRILIPMLCVLMCAVAQADGIPQSLQAYISCLEEAVDAPPAGISTVMRPIPQSVTRRQALEDVNALAYLIHNAYSGREFFEKHGVDFAGIHEGLRGHIAASQGLVQVMDLETLMAEGLSPLFDGHMSLRGHKSHRFYRHQDAYFGDILLRANEGQWVVIQSSVPGISTGAQLTSADPEKVLFKTLSPQGQAHYLIGILSDTYVAQVTLSFGGQDCTVPLHACRLGQTSLNRKTCELSHHQDIPVVNMQRFPGGSPRGVASVPYVEMGKKLRESSVFVLDLRGNPGGNSEYSRLFFEQLNGVAHWNMAFAVLQSPGTRIADNRGTLISKVLSGWWSKSSPKPAKGNRVWAFRQDLKEQAMGTYPGQAIVLADRHVSSSGEAAVAYSKSIRNRVLVGENTAGIGTFGDIRRYVLPHSRIRVVLPYKLFVSPELLEGRGFLPDYWIDSAEPVLEIARWLKHPRTYQVTFPTIGSVRDVDFETWTEGVPQFMKRGVGATSRGQGGTAQCVQDTDIVFEGNASLRCSGSVQTSTWPFLQQHIPFDVTTIQVQYAVKGQDLRREGHQFNSCYVGFMYRDQAGSKHFEIKSYHETFDWQKDAVTLDCHDKNDIQFTIFSNISGDFWVDDIRFTVTR